MSLREWQTRKFPPRFADITVGYHVSVLSGVSSQFGLLLTSDPFVTSLIGNLRVCLLRIQSL